MSIRQPAAERLVRQMLELPIYRVNPLSQEFVTTMAKIAMAHVEMDEQRQRSERLLESMALAARSTCAADNEPSAR